MSREWLADSENQELLYAMCEEAVATLAPVELPLLEEIFPQYMASAQQGDVETGASASGPFALSGSGELVVLAIIPLLIEVIGRLLSESGTKQIVRLGVSAKTEGEAAGDEIAIEQERLQQLVAQRLHEKAGEAGAHEGLVEPLVVAVINTLGWA